MEIYFKIFILLSVSCFCNGHLKGLGDFLLGAHHQIHSKVHEVAGAALGGFNINIGGHVSHSRPPVQQQPTNGGQGETVVVIVQETNQGNQGQGQPQNPYGPPQRSYGPPHQNDYPPNHEYNPNHGNNNPHSYKPGNNGQRPEQNGPSNVHNYGPENPNQNQNHNQGGQENNNQNSQGINNGNNYQNGYDHSNNNGYNNNQNQNGNEFTNTEEKRPNLNDNYKPMVGNNGQQQNEGHIVENNQKQTYDQTTKKPTHDEPLFVPLNDYTYGGDKINVNAPKRETDKTAHEETEDEFPIDIRFKDE